MRTPIDARSFPTADQNVPAGYLRRQVEPETKGGNLAGRRLDRSAVGQPVSRDDLLPPILAADTQDHI
jgi:hypothetical protein